MSSSLRVNTIVPSTGTNVAIGTANGTVTFTDSVNFVLGTGSSIFSPASNTLTFGTNDAERLRITSDGKVRLPDNGKLTLGAGDDLQIWSDNTDQYIRGEQNQLIVRSNNLKLQSYLGENYIHCAMNNAVSLYYDNVEKLETTSVGLTIYEDTDKTISFTGGIGEIGNVTGFQALNTAGSSLVDFGMRANTLRFATGSAERLRITSGGQVIIGDSASDLSGTHTFMACGAYHAFQHDGNTGTYLSIGLGAANGTVDLEADARSGGYPDMRFITTNTERLRIDSAGTIKCGTSSTLKAEINSAIGGHQFISQCSDNNNGFEIYQQHGSTTTRNTFAVYANTGGGGAQELQFSVRGDGCVTKPLSPAFSANLAGGNLNAATHNNVIIFNNEHFDKSNSYDTSNGRFTAPVAGLYYFGVQIYAGFALSGVRVLHAKFQKNGSDVASCDMFGGASDHGGTSYHPTGCGHILTELAVNDWIAFNSGGFSGNGSGHATIYAANGTRFFGYLVG